jgi:hypothetical protein
MIDLGRTITAIVDSQVIWIILELIVLLLLFNINLIIIWIQYVWVLIRIRCFVKFAAVLLLLY